MCLLAADLSVFNHERLVLFPRRANKTPKRFQRNFYGARGNVYGRVPDHAAHSQKEKNVEDGRIECKERRVP